MGSSNFTSIDEIKTVTRDRKKMKKVFFAFMRIKPTNEQNESRCNIPKNIKLLLSNINVTKLIKHDTERSFMKRKKNFCWNFFDKLARYSEKPEINMKLEPIICAHIKPKPVVAIEKSM